MPRLLLEGSPRGPSSNSALIASWLAEGIEAASGEKTELLHLSRQREIEAQVTAFLEADEVTLVFPLYTDSTPGIVKGFLDRLVGQDPGRLRDKRVSWVVHCGFPESAHVEPVAAWLHRLSARLGFVYLGVAIKSGSTPLNLIPTNGSSKDAKRFRELGADLAAGLPFAPDKLEVLAKPRRIPPAQRLLFLLLKPSGLLDLYWIVMLRRKGGWKKRFDRPWAAESTSLSRT